MEPQGPEEGLVPDQRVPMGFIPNFGRGEGQQFIGLHVVPEDLPDLEDQFDVLVNLPAGFRARIGLNETNLTRALGRGEYSLAEKIIDETTDPEFLNDGALAATPLNMVLTGRSSFFHQSRNLKLAMLLLQRGANPNLRIPNHDMESASESPIELLVRYYLKLTQIFGVPGSGKCRTSYRPNNFEETELMDTVGLNGELGGLGPLQITLQTRQLLDFCLENGGDPNLPTTDAAKTIYHIAVLAPNQDPGLLQRMLELGANVNLADVHNTTPLMDIIQLGDENRARSALTDLQSQDRSLLLDGQNCSLQSSLWRAMFQGQQGLAGDLVEAGASQACAARVETVPKLAYKLIPRHPSIKSTVPAILAPLLNDSPCTSNMNVRLPKRRYSCPRYQYSTLAALHINKTMVSPLVDSGHMQGDEVVEQVTTLIKLNTDHAVAGDSSVVDSKAVIPLMFGEVSAGLRQLAVRAILSQTLFGRSVKESLDMLDRVCSQAEDGGFMMTKLLVPASHSKILREEGDTVMVHEYEIELGSEIELSFGYEEKLENRDETIDLAIEDIHISDRPGSGEEIRIGNIQNNEHLGSENDNESEEKASSVDIIHEKDTSIGTEPVTDILETIDKLDRELEVIRTDSVLQTLDRDLAAWEEELQGTLDRINRYQVELSGIDLVPVRDVRHLRRRDRETGFGIEEAKKRSEQLLDELRIQRSILLKTDRDLETASVELNSEEEDVDKFSVTGHLNGTRQGSRRMLDANWSLGSYSDLVHREKAISDDFGVNSSSDSVEFFDTNYQDSENCLFPDEINLRRRRVTDHTEQLVPSLDISVSVPQSDNGPCVSVPPPCITSSEWESDTSLSSTDPVSKQTVAPTSPRTMANNLAILNERLFQQRRRIGAGAAAASTVRTPILTPTPPDEYLRNPPISLRSSLVPTSVDNTSRSMPGLINSSEEEEVDESDNSTDSDTWGGTFSLRHTRQQEEQTEQAALGDSSLVTRLTSRALNALTDRLGIPPGLRPCFALEAARYQLSLALFNHQSISCDRNCEGDESDSEESHWLATGTDESDDETAEENDAQPGLTESDSSDESSVSDFSQRSWFGSLTDEQTEGRPLSPHSDFSPDLSSSPIYGRGSPISPSRLEHDRVWLEDGEDLQRMRQFLASPGTEFGHSTDSESGSSAHGDN